MIELIWARSDATFIQLGIASRRARSDEHRSPTAAPILAAVTRWSEKFSLKAALATASDISLAKRNAALVLRAARDRSSKNPVREARACDSGSGCEPSAGSSCAVLRAFGLGVENDFSGIFKHNRNVIGQPFEDGRGRLRRGL